ncbi:hypothetical protein ACX2CK_13660 [Acinetobacter schindleri]|jgi:hypothetical protein|uniref:hypothetical protein n=1 Tax=Acinetobacter sp. 22323 TaxID=3453910 RepID=UPI003F85BF49
MPNIQNLSRITLLTSTLLLVACNQKDAPKQEATQQNEAAEEVMKELKTQPVKDFPQTADDQHDIAVLDDFEQRLQSLNEDIEAETERMRKEGNLTEEFMQQRQRDHIQSALTLLKNLELKTEQGRYIQGLIYQYWEQQQKLLGTTSSDKAIQHDAKENVKGLGQYLHAQEQLEHWRNQYAETQAKAQ